MNLKVTIQVQYEGEPDAVSRAILTVRGDELCPDCIKQQILDGISGLDLTVEENGNPYHYTPANLRALKAWGLDKALRPHSGNCPVCLNQLDSESCWALERALAKDDRQ
jgi:hypothetical protein